MPLLSRVLAEIASANSLGVKRTRTAHPSTKKPLRSTVLIGTSEDGPVNAQGYALVSSWESDVPINAHKLPNPPAPVNEISRFRVESRQNRPRCP